MNRRTKCTLRWLIACPLWLAGCAVDTASIQITERPNTLETRRYQESFDEVYYDLTDSGNLRLVFRKHQPASQEGDDLTQTIVVESLWRSVPGTTHAHRTQINGTVTYGLLAPKIGQMLTGAGSVFFEENKARDRLTGTLAHVTLESRGSTADDGFLQRIELNGTFSARRDPCKALQIANETKLQRQTLLAKRPAKPK